MGELNVFSLDQFINKYNLTSFVETGTGRGTGLKHAMKYNFKKLYSIEVMTELYTDIKKEINDSRVTLLNTTSLEGLTKIIPDLEGNTFFWLDAHFPGADCHIGDASYHDEQDKDLKLPLEKEVELIFKLRPNNKDVFIMDDLNLYEDGNYELGKMREDLVYLREKYNMTGLDFIKNSGCNHKLTRNFRHQGFVILTP